MRGLLIILSKVHLGILRLSSRNSTYGALLMSGEGRLGSGARAVRLMSQVVVNLVRRRTSRTSMRQSISRNGPDKSYFY
jgi:hypothetical protein